MEVNCKFIFVIIVVSCVVIVGLFEMKVRRYTMDTEPFQETIPFQETRPFQATDLIGRNTTFDNIAELGKSIIGIAKWLRVAELHARGAKTTDALKQAHAGMDTLLRHFGTSFSEVTKRKVFTSKSVCPEYYLNNYFDFPLFDLGYVVANCTYATDLDKLVTIVLIDNESNMDRIEAVLFGLRRYQKHIPVVIGGYGDHVPTGNNVVAIKVPKSSTEGQALNIIVSNVKTEFTLIARDVIDMNYDSRIDRLVREIERMNVPAVGGSIRNSDSIWHMACHQRAYQNSTLVYQEGYDESLHDCVFCDHIDGPFLIRTATLTKVKFDDQLARMGLYEDFFMRLGGEVALCPDSMFYVDKPERSRQTASWEVFGRKRNLYQLKFSSGPTIYFGCHYPYPCSKAKGFVRTPCCLEELANAKNDIMKMCERAGILCEFQAGSLLGAVKLNKVLPWELDGDIRFWHQNLSVLQTAGKSLNKKGYTFAEMESRLKCNTATKRMPHPVYFHLRTKHWRLEIYSFCALDSYDLLSNHRNRTKLLHNGYPIFGARNPSLATRNRYPQLYSHIQHSAEGGSWNIHKFSKCPVQGRHDCIDRYNVDGNIQFDYPIP